MMDRVLDYTITLGEELPICTIGPYCTTDTDDGYVYVISTKRLLYGKYTAIASDLLFMNWHQSNNIQMPTLSKDVIEADNNIVYANNFNHVSFHIPQFTLNLSYV